MIRITLALPDGRETVMANENDTVKDVLDQNNVNIGTATVMLDGSALDPAGMRKSFLEQGVNDDCTVALCAKLQNA